MTSNAKFKPIEEISAEGEAVPALDGLEIEAPPAEFDEHTKEHVLGEEPPPPPAEIKRGKKAMFPNAKSGKEGMKHFFANLKNNPGKIAKYSAFGALAIGVAFTGYQNHKLQRRMNAVAANSQQLYQMIKASQGQPAANGAGPDYSRAFQEVAGRLEGLDRRLSAVEQAPPAHAAAPAPAPQKPAAKAAAKTAAKPKLVAKAGKTGSRTPASVKGKTTKKRR